MGNPSRGWEATVKILAVLIHNLYCFPFTDCLFYAFILQAHRYYNGKKGYILTLSQC